MDMHEFNEARRAIQSLMVKACSTQDPNDIADLLLGAALHGLVIKPISEFEGDDVPTPICGFAYIPYDKGSRPNVNAYIYPADQH